ncbi:hypothetical protein [Limimaricola pyoseonensis]|uniref:Stability/partitioning determinant n=1 Tax=Limimaricola pyoseonensis TaxID=521013 RepID=A0A1G7L6M7_9RHOB|nr:hypothetical protein [Limimaricola pyoseonensis]SDF45085.1 hypothetical protein SAMN04488567_0406 [Limimaricola pyoseonensis]
MSDRERADLGFGDALDDFDPAEWAPAPRAPRPRPAAEETRQAAEKLGFRSREARAVPTPAPAPAAPEPAAPPQGGAGGRVQRRRRTGRNAQLNLKARPETIAAYTAIADAQGWGLGETLERAVELLERTYGKG